MTNPVTRAAGAAGGFLRRQRARRSWLDHLVRAGGRYVRVHATLMASGVTYYVFLALAPVTLLLVAVAGFVLRGDPLLQDELLDALRDAVPGETGDSLAQTVTTAVESATTFGLLGLLGVVFIGLAAMDKLRIGMDIVWRGRADPPELVADRARDLVSLFGLGVAGALSIALTAGATSVADQVLGLTEVDEVPGFFLVGRALPIVLAVAGATLLFLWLLKGVPGTPFGYRQVLPGAVFGAVGFEALKLVGGLYLAVIGGNVTASTFGGLVGLIVWINVVCRFAFFTACWTATLPAIEHADTQVPHGPAGPTPLPEVARVDERAASPAAGRLALGLLAVGALAGAAGSRLLPRLVSRRGDRGRPRAERPGAPPDGGR
ncbi:YihY/virulence factor BrkB family protein [Modestobacter sp. VKM Ac-2983]|uniref:YihY/virulence factor BrkB family protein n=1 Tax=Modestobacter sp. VKM Ac-2983 TaxID=3004137 RepID=UPI0022ABC20E|nr:YihY/virulence factor BrkB family protein [Modestobacter sp. VKM Ac-2983]MCZ2806422.1 YihY/virulence factor BrkB family protein [Modestobacter sp. VKM Ac-2983]